ncbi:MAG: EamA family transporter [Pseudomonadota bacterium]
MQARDLFLALLMVAIWGASFSVIKVALADAPPLLLSALRFFMVAFPWVFLVPRPKTHFMNVVAVGVLLGVLKFTFLFLALDGNIDAGVAAIVVQAQVFLTVMFSAVFFRERVRALQWTGMGLAAIGLAMFVFSKGGGASPLGIALIFGTALSWTGANLVFKRMGAVNMVSVMVWASLIPPPLLLALSLLFEGAAPLATIADISLRGWVLIVFLAYGATLICYAIWARLLKRYPAGAAAPVALAIPVFGVAVAALFLSERLTHLEVAAAALVMAGLTVSVAGEKLLARMRQAGAPGLIHGKRE